MNTETLADKKQRRLMRAIIGGLVVLGFSGCTTLVMLATVPVGQELAIGSVLGVWGTIVVLVVKNYFDMAREPEEKE